MYLREMGSVELLSREGEIAIAKRIEAGREAMIAGLCESPLTFQAIIIWRDELNEGKILLRDIIDLEATYQGPDAKPAPSQPLPGEGGEAVVQNGNGQSAPGAHARPSDDEAEEPAPEEFDDDEDDLENSLSLAAMEAELKPKVLETFDLVATNYKKLRKLQDQVVERALKNDSLSSGQEKRYKVLKDEIVAEIKSLSLNANRIECWSRRFTTSTRSCSAMRAGCSASPRAMACTARISSANIRATSSTPTGSAASAA